MRCTGIVAGLLAGALAASAASAADWSGKGTLGGVIARGNTETETVNAIVDVQAVIAPWTHKFGGSILRTTTDDVTSADRWELRGETNYDLSGRSYLFGALRYEDDAFTDFAYQATAAAGYGYRFIRTYRTTLEGQIGAGYRQTELREHALTETTLLYEKFLVESGRENTFVQNQLGIEVKINARFALGLAYTLPQHRRAPGTRNSDQVYTATLSDGFL